MLKFEEKIKEVKQKYADTGHPHHLVRMRNIRLKFGHRIKGADPKGEKPEMKKAPDPFPDLKNGIPEIDYKDLKPAILAGAIQHHGALIVRNIMPQKHVKSLRDRIDETFDESDRFFSGKGKPPPEDPVWKSQWFRTDLPIKGYFKLGAVNIMLNTGSIWTFLSPNVSNYLLEVFEKVKLRRFLDRYFGGRTCVSFNKSVLRRMDPLKAPADWHQDGSFMTAAIKSINLWVALSECGEGTDCPGMDFVPRRFDEIVETGTNEAHFDWSVSQKTVREKFADTPPVTPHFNEGDGIFFDHFNLHVTSYDPGYTRKRYALETWFFPEEYAAKNQLPIAW